SAWSTSHRHRSRRALLRGHRQAPRAGRTRLRGGVLMARTAPSVYVPLDVNYMRDPRIRRAGADAELLYLRSLAYAKGGETDGMVHDYDLDVIAVGLTKVKARVEALVREKAWEPREGGWFISGWFNWNESTITLRDKRKR